MKRKILFGLFPALMALSACAGVAFSEKIDGANLFLEDTAAHEEILGEVQSDSLLKGIRNTYTPVGENEPLIAIQSKQYILDAKKYVAIRFVAAVNLANPTETELKWERKMYDPYGASFKSYKEDLPVTKLYNEIYDGETLVNISTIGGGIYNRFVMYTMRNIPANDYGNYSLNVSLSIAGEKTKIVSTSVDQLTQMAFSYDQSGYFLYGDFNQYDDIIPQDKTTINNEENNASFTIPALKANDTFVVVNKTESIFKVYDYSSLRNESIVCFANSDRSAKTIFDGSYTLYFTKSNELHTVSTIERTPGYYLTGGFVGEDWNDLWEQYKLAPAGDLPISKTINFPHANLCKVVKVDNDGKITTWYGGEGDKNVSIDHTGVYTLNVASNGVFSVEFVRPISFKTYLKWEPVTDCTRIMLSNDSNTIPTIGQSVKLSSFNKEGNDYVLYSSEYTYAHVSWVIDNEIIDYATVSLYDLKDHNFGFSTNCYQSGDDYVCEILNW